MDARELSKAYSFNMGNTLCERPLSLSPVPGVCVTLTAAAAIKIHKQRRRAKQKNIDIFNQELCLPPNVLNTYKLKEISWNLKRASQIKKSVKVRIQCCSRSSIPNKKSRVFIEIMEFNKIHDCCGTDISNGVFGRIVRKCIQEITSIENHLSFGLAIAVALCIFIFLKWLQRWWFSNSMTIFRYWRAIPSLRELICFVFVLIC